MKLGSLVLVIFSLLQGISAQGLLEVPVQGTQGDKWVIVNYVDWDTTAFIDYNCGSKSYSGHQGTDFVVRSFAAMDDGVAVYAAAAGVVTHVVDSLFDRETAGDIAKQLGNVIALSHADKLYTYYGHLKQHSAQVAVGDSVEMGQLIGYIGSSGNSTDPHLHFELWYDSLYVIDPLAGMCGNVEHQFIDPPAYDTTVTVWDSGLHLKRDLTINDLRERITTIEEPYVIAPQSDSSLYFWAHLYGLRAGKDLSIRWYSPTDIEWFEYSITLDRDYWYYYYWSFIDHVDLPAGDWIVKLFYEDAEISAQSFTVDPLTSTAEASRKQDCQGYATWSPEQLVASTDIDLQIIGISGQPIVKEDLDLVPPGIYFFRIERGDDACVIQRWVD